MAANKPKPPRVIITTQEPKKGEKVKSDLPDAKIVNEPKPKETK